MSVLSNNMDKSFIFIWDGVVELGRLGCQWGLLGELLVRGGCGQAQGKDAFCAVM